MPFVAAAGPILGALGLGGSIAGAFGGGGGGIPDFAEENARRAAAFGHRFEPFAYRGMKLPFQYYKGILSGDRSKMMQAIAPEVRNVTDLYQQGLQQRELTPRGGGTSQFYANLPFQQARSIMDIYQRARPAAAQGLAQLGAQASQNVLGGYGVGQQGAGQLLDYNLQRWQQQFQSGQGIGGALFELLRMFQGGGNKYGPVTSGVPSSPLPDYSKIFGGG